MASDLSPSKSTVIGPALTSAAAKIEPPSSQTRFSVISDQAAGGPGSVRSCPAR